MQLADSHTSARQEKVRQTALPCHSLKERSAQGSRVGSALRRGRAGCPHTPPLHTTTHHSLIWDSTSKSQNSSWGPDFLGKPACQADNLCPPFVVRAAQERRGAGSTSSPCRCCCQWPLHHAAGPQELVPGALAAAGRAAGAGLGSACPANWKRSVRVCWGRWGLSLGLDSLHHTLRAHGASGTCPPTAGCSLSGTLSLF